MCCGSAIDHPSRSSTTEVTATIALSTTCRIQCSGHEHMNPRRVRRQFQVPQRATDPSCDRDDLYSTYYSAGTITVPEGGPSERRRLSLTGSPPSARPDIDMVRLEPSRLLDILTKKSSFTGSFISIPEIQARNRVLRHRGLTEDEYLCSSPPCLRTP